MVLNRSFLSKLVAPLQHEIVRSDVELGHQLFEFSPRLAVEVRQHRFIVRSSKGASVLLAVVLMGLVPV